MNFKTRITAYAVWTTLSVLFSFSAQAQLLTNKDVLKNHVDNQLIGATTVLTQTVMMDSIIWGDNPGEGDFDGGLNGWTTVNDNNACPGFDLWRWSPNGTATNGAFSAGGGISEAPTAANGAMAFDSDFYDNNGSDTNIGFGDCPAIHIGELISPTIDLASLIGPDVVGVSLSFHQASRQFTSTYIVSYSNDDGVTWNDITINQDFAVNSPHLNEFESVFLPDADLTSSTFKVKFRYEGNYYYWIIDDVQLVQTPGVEFGLSDDFFAIAPNAVTPISQLEPYSHLIDISNTGAEELTDVNVNVEIVEDQSNTVVFSDETTVPIIPVTSTFTAPFPNYFTPDNTTPSSYTATYSASIDGINNDSISNNINYTLMTSDTTFAKDFGSEFAVRPADANWDINKPHNWAYGNYYRIVNGESWYASSVTFSIETNPALADNFLTAYLYHWPEDSNGDGFMDPDERIRVGFAVYLMDGTETANDLITLPLLSFPDGNPIVDLESNSDYVLMLEFITTELGVDLEIGVGEANYQPTINRSLFDNEPRFASLIAIGNPSDVSFSTNAFNGLVPVVRLNIATAELTVLGEPSNVICNGECNGSIDLQVNGGVPDYTFAWTGPDGFTASTEDLSDLCAGTYEVLITDSQGDSVNASFVVEEPNLLATNAQVMNASCPQTCDGAIVLSTNGGIGPFSFAWSDGSSSEDLVGLCAGSYEVTITDQNACTLVESFVIDEPLEMIPSFEFAVFPCASPCQDSIDLTVTNGTAPLSFEWYDAFGNLIANTEDLANVCPGTYTVNVIDANGCIITSNPEIENASFPVATADLTNTNCFQSCDGSLDLSITGGEQPYTYEWSNGLPAQEDQVDLCAGVYTATVTDNTGCSNVISLNVEEPTELVSTVSTTNTICANACDGTAEILTMGGTMPYSANGLLEELCAGAYNVTITDANGCTESVDFIIDEPAEILIDLDEVGNEMESMMNGFVNISVVNGIPPFSYAWTDENGDLVSTEEDPSGLAMGTYNIQVFDANGCFSSLADIEVDNIVAVTEPELENGLKVFPNPTSGLLQLDFELPETSDIEIEFYDLTGRLMQTQIVNAVSNQMISTDISHLSNGVYTLKVKIDDVFIARKIIKY